MCKKCGKTGVAGCEAKRKRKRRGEEEERKRGKMGGRRDERNNDAIYQKVKSSLIRKSEEREGAVEEGATQGRVRSSADQGKDRDNAEKKATCFQSPCAVLEPFICICMCTV